MASSSPPGVRQEDASPLLTAPPEQPGGPHISSSPAPPAVTIRGASLRPTSFGTKSGRIANFKQTLELWKSKAKTWATAGDIPATGSISEAGSTSQFHSQPYSHMPGSSFLSGAMAGKGASTSVATMPLSTTAKPGERRPMWRSNSGMTPSNSAANTTTGPQSTSRSAKDGERPLMTTHKQVRSSLQQSTPHEKNAFFTIDGDEPEGHGAAAQRRAGSRRSSTADDDLGSGAYDPQQLFDDAQELRPEQLLQLHDSSSSLASVPAHLVQSPVPSGTLPSISKPLIMVAPADDEPSPQAGSGVSGMLPAVAGLPSSSIKSTPLSKLFSSRAKRGEHEERPSGPLASLRDRSSQMLRKLKGIMPDFNRSSRKQGPLHQLLEGSSAAAAQQQQLEEMQEHPEAEAEAQESRSSSGPFRAWSPTNTLFGDRGLGSVPVETPTASLQDRISSNSKLWLERSRQFASQVLSNDETNNATRLWRPRAKLAHSQSLGAYSAPTSPLFSPSQRHGVLHPGHVSAQLPRTHMDRPSSHSPPQQQQQQQQAAVPDEILFTLQPANNAPAALPSNQHSGAVYAMPFGMASLAGNTIPEEDADSDADSDNGVLMLDGSHPVEPVEPEAFEADYEQAEQAGMSLALQAQVAPENEAPSAEDHLMLLDIGSDSDSDDDGLPASAPLPGMDVYSNAVSGNPVSSLLRSNSLGKAPGSGMPPRAPSNSGAAPSWESGRMRQLGDRLRSIGSSPASTSPLPKPAML